MIRFFNRKYPTFIVLLCAATIIMTLLFIITGAYIQDGFDLTVGSVSPKRFTADYSFKNEVATNKKIEEAVSSVSPLYTHNPQIQEDALAQLDIFFSDIEKSMEKTAEKTSGDKSKQNSTAKIQTVNTKIYLSEDKLAYLRSLTKEKYDSFKQGIYETTISILEQGIREDSVAKSFSVVRDELSGKESNETLLELAYSIVTSVIEPNLVVDTEATEKAKAEKAEAVEPIMVLKNQKIVDEGEIINEETYAILESLGYTAKVSFKENLPQIFGVCIFITLLLLLGFYYLKNYHNELKNNKKEMMLIFTVYILLIVLTRLLSGVPYMFIPILCATMLISMLISARIAIIFNLITTIVCYFIYSGDIIFVIYFIIAGIMTAIYTKNIPDRTKIILVGFWTSLFNSVLIASLTLFFDTNWQDNILLNIGYAAVDSFLILIIAIGSLPMWEAVFGVVTTVKLLDLINPDKYLLKRLMLESPGTYHHSLIVANLAEAAALRINANAVLARVGSYYHDIGKLAFPHAFSENSAGENIHDKLDPYSSAKIISEHIPNGIKLAQENKLPRSVIDIISQHHGNTLIKFFYHKATQQDENVKEEDFRYKYNKPQTKEAAIVMLADTVEAAVRSVINKGKTMEEIKAFVHTLIKDKLDDGQLSESNLAVNDLRTIEDAFMSIFKGMYHERISYPEIKKETTENTAEE